MRMPAQVGDYTDFYVGIHHATNVGKLFRPDNPLMPNYKWVPIGYHGRASSIRISGAPVRRPNGQTQVADEPSPTFGPSERLDYELELGVWIGPGNALGEPIADRRRRRSYRGISACSTTGRRAIFRPGNISRWGRFSPRTFHSTISPWIVTPEALAPFRTSPMKRAVGDPQPLAYLMDATRPERRRARSRARGVPADARDEARASRSLQALSERRLLPLLDPRADARPSHVQRLQSRSRRSPGVRHASRRLRKAATARFWKQPTAVENRFSFQPASGVFFSKTATRSSCVHGRGATVSPPSASANAVPRLSRPRRFSRIYPKQ